MVTEPTRPAPWTYRPELDGMRAFGALVIIFFHAEVAGFSASFIVLDMFFVLSGFVVTNVVLAEIDAKGDLKLGAYYARRVRRLLPAAVATITLTCALFVLVASQPERLPLVRQAQAALLYLANWKFVRDDADYFAGDIRESPFMHFWSLSVEEQYYIFFPLLVLAWLRWGKARPRLLLGVVGVLMTLSVVAQVVWGRIDPMRAYFGTDTRLFQLLAGVAIAIALREYAAARGPDGALAWPRAGRLLALSGAAGFVVFGSELISLSVSHRNLLATVISAALMVGVYTAPTTAVARFLSHQHMTYLGKISYGIYLWHWPVIVVLDRIFEVPPALVALMTLPLAIGLAAVSYRFLESPIRTGRRLDAHPWPSVTVGVAVSLAVALVVVGPVLGSGRSPAVAVADRPAAGMEVSERALDREQVARRLGAPVPRDLDYERVAKDRGLGSRSCGPEDLTECLVADGDGPHVVLVGDSHARMLSTSLRDLAREKGLKLSASMVPACPWPHGLVSTRARERNQERCRDARQGFYARTLPRLEPDVVILMNAPRTDLSWERTLVGYDGRPQQMPQAYQRAVTRTLELVEQAGASAVIVKSLMGTEGWGIGRTDPLDCLARARSQGECVVVPPIDRPPADSYYDVAAGASSAAATVDLNPVVCPDHPTCLPIVDGEVVWRDTDHVSAAYLRAHREEIWDSLVATGFLDSP